MITNQAEYDAAKIRLSGADESLVYYIELKAEMLEYRRQNGFFEVGDYIVDTLIGNKVVEYHGGYKDMPGNYVSSFLMHATDAEIKVGRRLDLPETVVQSLGEIS